MLTLQVLVWAANAGVGITQRPAETMGIISNNPSFCLKHPAVPNGSDSSDGTLYPLTEYYMLPVTQATGRVAYLPPLLCAWYTHHQNDTCVTLLAGLQLCCSHSHNAWRCLCLSSANSHILPLRYCYISDAALAPYMFSFEILWHSVIQSSLQIPHLPLHLLRHYRILQVWNMQSNLDTC